MEDTAQRVVNTLGTTTLTKGEKWAFALRRCAARLVDACISAVVLFTVFEIGKYAGLREFPRGLSIYATCFYLFLDAVVFSISKTTPGRKIFGVGFASLTDKPITFWSFLSRNIGVFVLGLWCGLLFPIAMLTQLVFVARRGRTPYDNSCGMYCYLKPFRITNILLGVFVIAMCWVLPRCIEVALTLLNEMMK